ncbi:MAG: TM1812 family CRISPR-associated protein [Oscillospiraceae bacterium]|nr:TM1812 family CRISPR-associated protein [Oscillospiraceae bacterium]
MKKTKTFITAIPFQAPNPPIKKPYKGYGNSRLDYDEAHFPIIPAINGYTEKGDDVRIIIIKKDTPIFERNYRECFLEDINKLKEKKGFASVKTEFVDVIDSEDIDTQLKLFSDIVDAIKGNEEVSACITFGTKPTPIILSMALNYAYRLKVNVSIGCVVYGRYDPKETISNKNGVYDTTALFYMNEIVNKLAEMKVPNPETAIKIMLGIGGEEDND